jgi:hypothetical protein
MNTVKSEQQLRVGSTDEWVPWKQWLNQPLVFMDCGIRAAESDPDDPSKHGSSGWC